MKTNAEAGQFTKEDLDAAVSSTFIPISSSPMGRYISSISFGDYYDDLDSFRLVREGTDKFGFTSYDVRLKLKSEGGTNYDGFYFEDALVEKIINVSTELSSINSYPEIKLFPNPASEKLFINFETSHVKTFFVCDITGKIIFLGSFTNKINEINLSELSNGIYFLKIIDHAKTPIVKKFTVVKN